ncbi:uncharacterized protein LOC130591739 [Beta vulgaris subsp. vulgaris]|uniref:uncharacterized protein LOC130591739 n=1 Tax=Beta vulgaris subsp. vulgaris TaxID=3555 RepID=UPI0025475BC4|nr:uncharacterized protein LOC130591739 [Beta vulgaris subsp. vulgaris]
MNHILRSCPRAIEVWKEKKIPINNGIIFNEWLKENITKVHNSSSSLNPSNVDFIFLIWGLWLRRNAWVFSKKNVSSSISIKKSHWAATEWFYSTNQPKVGKAPNSNLNSNPNSFHPYPTSNDLNPTLRWSPPPASALKINVDSSFILLSKKSGLVAICRDSLGRWQGGIWRNTYCSNALEAEIRGILMAVNWVINKDWRHCIIASDCKNAVEEVHNNSGAKSVLFDDIHICRVLLQRNAGIELKHEGRSANKAADALAKYAQGRFTGHNVLQELSSPPPVCINFLEEDIRNCNMEANDDDHG